MPLYLSEIKVCGPEAAKLMPRDGYGWHKVLWRFFPQREAREFLYRVDAVEQALRLYVLSSIPIQVPDGMAPGICRSREIPESFLSHTNYRFQLRANPTKRLASDARTGQRLEKGPRIPITGEAELAAWLRRKGEQGGFSIPGLEHWPEGDIPLRITPEKRNEFRKPGLDKAHHSSVQFSGILHVDNATQFRQCFEKGIGSAKSFGFGLLLLQPIS